MVWLWELISFVFIVYFLLIVNVVVVNFWVIVLLSLVNLVIDRGVFE